MVTVGRLLFAAIVRWLPARLVYHLLPIVLVAAFALIASLPDNTPRLGVAVTISLGQDALTTMSAGVAGGSLRSIKSATV